MATSRQNARSPGRLPIGSLGASLAEIGLEPRGNRIEVRAALIEQRQMKPANKTDLSCKPSKSPRHFARSGGRMLRFSTACACSPSSSSPHRLPNAITPRGR